MILGTGIDITEIGRIKKALTHKGFALRVFTTAERDYCEGRGVQKAASYGARFAGKEAVMKAFGTGLSQGSWQDIEIIVNEQGKPEVVLKGYFASLAEQMGVSRVHITLSHAREYAVAQAMLEGDSR